MLPAMSAPSFRAWVLIHATASPFISWATDAAFMVKPVVNISGSTIRSVG